MKKYFTLIFGCTLSLFGFTQSVNDYTLDLNNADATVNDGGVFFNQSAASLHGFSIPSGSQLHTIFALGFWYGGTDVNGQLKLSAQKYENLKDQFKGPLSNDGSATPPGSGTWTNSIFPVTLDEINTHLANYTNAGYVIPPNIANWPAHGDLSLMQDYYLAPFVDVNSNGVYEPGSGEYPCIRGDQAVYVIMNDKGGIHESGGDPIGIEMHYMFYEYVAQADINNTVFVSGKVINRGTQTLQDFKMSVFMDGDIGYSGDDYFSSDSTRNLMSFYNGDNMDEASGGSSGYGVAPPASGIVSLSNDFESIGAILDFAPTSAPGYWNLMNGLHLSGAPWTNIAGSAPTKFLFASDPGSLSETESEVALSTPPGDRRGIATLDFGTFEPSEEYKFDYAVIYNKGTVNNVDNASGLRNVADNVQDFFDQSITGDCLDNQGQVGLNELSEAEVLISPNPSNGQFTISLTSSFSNAEVEIYDVTGRIVLNRKELMSNQATIKLDEPSGLYLVYLTVDGQQNIQRIVLE